MFGHASTETMPSCYAKSARGTVARVRARTLARTVKNKRDATLESARRYYGRPSRDILTKDQAKFRKTMADSVRSGGTIWYQIGLTLSPAREAGIGTLCAYARECEGPCLKTTYRQRHHRAVDARIRRTVLWSGDPGMFEAKIRRELTRGRVYAQKLGARFAFRPNVLSDVLPNWMVEIMRENPADQYIDYTKNPHRYAAWLDGSFPSNYHVTFSRQPSNHAVSRGFVARGGTATIVVRNKATKARMMRDGFEGFPCVDGDPHDRRWEDPSGVWVLLTAKGLAKKSQNGFVMD